MFPQAPGLHPVVIPTNAQEHPKMKMNILAAATILSLGATLPVAAATSAITFKPVPTASGAVLWMNSVIRAAGISVTQPTTVCVTQQVVTYKVGRDTFTIDIPNAVIQYKPWESVSSLYFSGTDWSTSAPSTSGVYETFVSGTEYPSVLLPAGSVDMTWSARFDTDVATGVSLAWRWGGASYSQFTDNESALNVVPTDVRFQDRAGTPFAFKNYVVGGNDADTDDYDDNRFTGLRSVPKTAVADFSATCGGAY
jgi:hypothetical protein